MKEIQQNDVILYQCEEYGLKYKAKVYAAKREAWCTEYKSCNLDIIVQAEKSNS